MSVSLERIFQQIDTKKNTNVVKRSADGNFSIANPSWLKRKVRSMEEKLPFTIKQAKHENNKDVRVSLRRVQIIAKDGSKINLATLLNGIRTSDDIKNLINTKKKEFVTTHDIKMLMSVIEENGARIDLSKERAFLGDLHDLQNTTNPDKFLDLLHSDENEHLNEYVKNHPGCGDILKMKVVANKKYKQKLIAAIVKNPNYVENHRLKPENCAWLVKANLLEDVLLACNKKSIDISASLSKLDIHSINTFKDVKSLKKIIFSASESSMTKPVLNNLSEVYAQAVQTLGQEDLYNEIYQANAQVFESCIQLDKAKAVSLASIFTHKSAYPLLTRFIQKGDDKAIDFIFSMAKEISNDDVSWYINQAVGKKGITPLMAATSTGNFKVVKELMKYSPGLNMTDNKGKTAYMYAGDAPKNGEKIARFLVSRGASIEENLPISMQEYRPTFRPEYSIHGRKIPGAGSSR